MPIKNICVNIRKCSEFRALLFKIIYYLMVYKNIDLLEKTMLATENTSLVSKEEYLRLERVADTRSEYHQGQILAMAGASRNHNRIVTNVSTSLDVQFRKRDCNNYSNDMRVSIQKGDRFLYPDIVVTCGKEEFDDQEIDSLLNPVVIIEVLSKSTEAYDRGLKFLYYQGIKSLQEYVLITQNPKRVEVYSMQRNGNWSYHSFNDISDEISLKSVNCQLMLNDLYIKCD